MRQNDGGWSPYLAGALSGLVGVLSVWFTGHYFGASTSFVRTAGMIERLLSPDHVARLEYFAKIARAWIGSGCSSSGSFSVP